MKKIPVTVNNNLEHIVGFLEIDERAVPDEVLSDMFVSWQYIPEEDKIIGMTLLPMMSRRKRAKRARDTQD